MRRREPRVLMPVFGALEYDGRVRRIAEAVAARFPVTVLSLHTGRRWPAGAYAVRTVAVPAAGRFKLTPHLAFWAAVVGRAVRDRPAVVHAHDYFLAFPGWLAARLCGAKFVYDAHELVIPGGFASFGRRDKFWYVLERWAVRRADRVIAANAERAEIMRDHYDLAALPVVVRNIPPRGAEELPPRRRPDGKIRLLYQGDVALDRQIGEFVVAMTSLPDEYELLIVGGGPDVERVRALIASSGAGGKVRMLPRVPSDELPALMREADIGVISYPKTGLNNIYCAPNKLYEYAQAGLPMVGTANPVLERVFADYGIGAAGEDVPAAIRAVAERLAAYRAGIPGFLAAHRWETDADVVRAMYADLLDASPTSRGATALIHPVSH